MNKKLMEILVLTLMITSGFGSVFEIIENVKADPGDVVGSIDSPGECPEGLAWDGSYLWNADWCTLKIYKLDPSDGSIVDSFDSPGSFPRGLTWDGSYIWLSDDDTLKIYKLDPSDGSIVDSFDSPGSGPRGLAWDGSYLWNANTDYSGGDDNKIYKLTTSGTVVDSFNSPGSKPLGLTWDGNYLWNVDFNDKKIYKLTTSGTVVDSFNSPEENPLGLTWDGNYLWNSNNDWPGNEKDKIYKIDAGGTSNDPPNNPSKPSGPTSGFISVSYDYFTSTIDPDNDDVKYGWDWDGDNNVDEWTGFYSSGTTAGTSYSWSTGGTYNVKVRAEDSNGAQSGFSNTLQVVISSGNQPPDTPGKPFGTTSVIVHHNHRYQTSATDPDGDRVQYYFDWGDGKGDWTIGFVESGETDGTDYIWREPGDYQVKAKARDEHGAESGWSEPLTVTVEEEVNHPPNKPSLDGDISGKTGERYTYCASTNDPEGDQIEYYMWDWGDGIDRRTIKYGPFDSGETVCAEHIWDEDGSYEIYVWAQDVNGALSYPSDPLIVSMPKLKLVNLFQFNSLQKLIEDSLLLKWFLWFSSFGKTTLSQVTK